MSNHTNFSFKISARHISLSLCGSDEIHFIDKYKYISYTYIYLWSVNPDTVFVYIEYTNNI